MSPPELSIDSSRNPSDRLPDYAERSIATHADNESERGGHDLPASPATPLFSDRYVI
jgi:hypothetical protein